MRIGKNSVAYGSFPPGTVIGDNCVYVGATDQNGNCIINKPMTLGFGARGNSTSIVIGAFAGGGRDRGTDDETR